ncbi:MAG TPA: mechanosensitive ion channel protein MscS [Verrucomicrobia subdivision 6 bacterium]|jgi:moderate conductance mechanosensitive channel|nr:mechanosensitive ion channel protein MscS [Verrucomicrobia subdivision 6 bacterium]HCP06355.1 mechanosensitive ion channel protein MscS [Verrucomicrobiales bacterium]
MLNTFVQSIWSDLGLGQAAGWAKPVLSGVTVLLIVLLAFLSAALARRFIMASHKRLAARAEGPEERKRIETLERVFRYIASVVVTVVAFMLVLSQLGISIAHILATAGVAGLTIGFGAQSLVKDYFTGFVMLIENQIRVGDVVEVAGKVGAVEELTLRYVRLRDYEGAVHYVPNGAILTVTNRSRLFAFAVMDIGVAYKEDIERVSQVMKETATAFRSEPDWADKILDDLEIAGVDQWADSAVVIKCRLKTMAQEQWAVRRAFLGRLKNAFDRAGIEIPYPHRTVYTLPADSADHATSKRAGTQVG